jgi:AraC-like DNA-binding protein
MRGWTYRGGLSRARLNRVLDCIHAHVGDNLELNTLAEAAGLNVCHFARAFKQSTGENSTPICAAEKDRSGEGVSTAVKAAGDWKPARTGLVDQSSQVAAEGKVKATIEDQPLESINDVFDRLKTRKVNGRVVLDMAVHANRNHFELVAAHA